MLFLRLYFWIAFHVLGICGVLLWRQRLYIIYKPLWAAARGVSIVKCFSFGGTVGPWHWSGVCRLFSLFGKTGCIADNLLGVTGSTPL
jgi:hypothetical protein